MHCINQVVLGLGSNRSYNGMEPERLLQEGCRQLACILSNFTVSSVYRTKPMYVENQANFFNMVVSGTFNGNAFELLEAIHKIEDEFGRNRANEIRNGPRPLDIDIELFGNEIIKNTDLVIPHPRITERAFVLVPLLEILPDCADVITGKPYADFLSKLSLNDIQEVRHGRNNINIIDKQ